MYLLFFFFSLFPVLSVQKKTRKNFEISEGKKLENIQYMNQVNDDKFSVHHSGAIVNLSYCKVTHPGFQKSKKLVKI